MGGTQDKRQQPGQPGKGPDEVGTERKRPSQDPSRTRPQQPEKPSRGMDEESKRRREEDLLREGDIEGDEL